MIRKKHFQLENFKNNLMAKALKSPVHCLLLWWALEARPWLEHSVDSYPVSSENLETSENTSSEHYFSIFLS